MAKDYYDILGVGRNASDDEIKKAYRKRAHEHHPDKKGGNEAKFKEVNEAYQVLSDKQKRTQYDTYGRTFEGAGAPPGGGSGGFGAGGFEWNVGGEGFGDIFENFFSGGFGGAQQQRARRGVDIRAALAVTLEDSAHGVEKQIHLKRDVACTHCKGLGAEPHSKIVGCSHCGGTGQVRKQHRTMLGTIVQSSPCEQCHGRGEKPEHACASCHGTGVKHETSTLSIRIPQSIDEGETVRFSGMGNAGHFGTPAGDLYIQISLAPHRMFTRDGDDLYITVPVSFSQASLGDKVEVQTLWGSVYLKVPAGVQSGSLVKISGKGMSKRHGFGKGDLLAKIQVKTPDKLSRRQKELLEELKKEGI
ncbi:MAG: molecular chaperone DnaJ [Patescibacteria group bacterium]